MKLDNKGWGTKEFIFSIVAILILLLVVAVNVHRLYFSLDSTINSSYGENTNNNVNNNTNTNTNNDIINNEEDNQEEVEYNEQYYKDYQNKMINATRNYIVYTTPTIPNEGLKIELSTLVSKNYINPLNDMLDNSPCSGYSQVSIYTDSSLNIKTYLNCSHYVTEGY